MSKKRYLVTGCAGFIGSHLTDTLLNEGHEVIGIDNFSTGFEEFLEHAKKSSRFTLIRGNLLEKAILDEAVKKIDLVFHLAANADVRFGVKHPQKDFEQNALTTLHLLESMRKNKVSKIVFASTGSIYGESSMIPTPEFAPFPLQTSLYGASKLAAEGFIQAYCEGFDFQSYIFRFVSILGERYTHGHVFDFYKQLQKNQNNLTILGNGKQCKSYLYIKDCIHAMLFVLNKVNDRINIFNLGTNEYCNVDQSVNWICEYLGLNPQRYYTGGERGWIGDNPFLFLDTQKICNLGWQPKLTIQEGITKTIQYLETHPWVLEQRI